MLPVPRWWTRALGISSDWWDDYRKLSGPRRAGMRKRVWDGRAETDPRLLPIAAAYAAWSSSPRAVRLHRIAVLIAALVFGFFLALVIDGVAGVAVGAAFVVLYYGTQTFFDRRRAERSAAAAALDRSALQDRPSPSNT